MMIFYKATTGAVAICLPLFLAVALLIGFSASTADAQDAIEAWDGVLSAYQKDGGMDYGALHADRTGLDRVLGLIAESSPEAMSDQEAMAFWINAYNAGVVQLVLERYPEIESVKAVSGFFDQLEVKVAGRSRTLDEIEKEALAFGDPRVHFAVVCASIGCPDLRFEAYCGARIERQLADQTKIFLSDSSKGLRFDEQKNVLWLSSIFKWYAGDFTGGNTVMAFFLRSAVLDWVLELLPTERARTIEKGDPSVRYLDYDWGLNDHKR